MNSLNPPTTGSIFTPLTENAELRESAQSNVCQMSSISHYLNKVVDDFYTRDLSDADRKKQKKRTNRWRRYATVDHNGTITEEGEYNDLEGYGDDYFFGTKMNTYLASRLPQLLQAQTKLVVTPRWSQEIKYKRVAEFLQKQYEKWLAKTNTINKRQREIKWNLLASGDTYRFLFLNERKVSKVIEIPTSQVEEVVERKGGVWACPMCAASGEQSDLDAKDMEETVVCPQCQFEQVKVTPITKTEYEMREKGEQLQICELDFDIPDANEISVIWTNDEIAEALAVIWTTKMPRCLIEQEFPNAKIPRSNVDDEGINEEEDNFKREDGEIDTNTQMIRVQRVWLNSSVYEAAKTNKPEQIAVGRDDKEQTIQVPAGSTILKEIFRKGLYLIRVGQKTILQTYEQAIGDVWTHSVNEIGEKGYGTGEWEICEIQYQQNEARTLRMQKLLNDSIQNPIVRDGYIDEYPNKAGAIITVTDAPNDMSFDNIVGRTPAADFPQEAALMEESLSGEMQERLGAMATGTGDMPDMNAIKGTAAGYQMYQNHTLERSRPLLQMRADNLDLPLFYQYWQAFRDFQSQGAAEKYFDDVPKEIVEWFYEMDIRRDFDVTVVPNSYMPKTKEQRQIEFHNWYQLAAPMYANDPVKLQSIERQMVEIFDGVEVEEQSAEQEEAQLRLDRIIEAAQAVEAGQKRSGSGVTDPNGFILMPLINVALQQAKKLCKTLQTVADPFPTMPIDVLLDEHTEFMDVYQDFLRSPNGRKLSQFVRSVISTMIAIHSQATPMKEIYIQSLFNQIQSAQNEFEMGEQAKAAQMQMQQQQMQSAQMMEQQMMEQQMAQGQFEAERENEAREVEDELAANEVLGNQKLQQAEAENSQKFGFQVAQQALKDESNQATK